MDGTAAIQNNLETLKRILAGLVSMAGLGDLSLPLAGEDGSARRGDVSAEAQRAKAEAEPLAEPGEGYSSRWTLPRHLRLAILRLLRPAEAAARRLIIATARGLVVTLPPPRKRKPKPATVEPELRRFGIAVVLSPADLASAILPRSRGRVTAPRVLPLASPRTGSAGGGGGEPQPAPFRVPCLPLFDPPRRFLRNGSRRHVPAHAVPRISFPGGTAPHPEARTQRASKDDPIDATRLTLRLAALAAALDDLPGQARRFARWKAFRERERNNPSPNRIKRASPLRPGRPPGGRLARYDPAAPSRRNIREVDEVLAHAHALALHALQNPDTS